MKGMFRSFQPSGLCSFSLLLLFSYITALQLEVILDFISTVIVRHFPFLCVGGQIGRKSFSLEGKKHQMEREGRR